MIPHGIGRLNGALHGRTCPREAIHGVLGQRTICVDNDEDFGRHIRQVLHAKVQGIAFSNS